MMSWAREIKNEWISVLVRFDAAQNFCGGLKGPAVLKRH